VRVRVRGSAKCDGRCSFLLEQFDLTGRFGGDAMPTAKML
jgi:hypothetical protein